MTFAALFVSEKREKKKSFFMILLSDQKRDKEKVSHRAEKSAPSFFRKHKNRTAPQSCFVLCYIFSSSSMSFLARSMHFLKRSSSRTELNHSQPRFVVIP